MFLTHRHCRIRSLHLCIRTVTVLLPIVGKSKVQIRVTFSGVKYISDVTRIRPAVHELKHVELVTAYVLCAVSVGERLG